MFEYDIYFKENGTNKIQKMFSAGNKDDVKREFEFDRKIKVDRIYKICEVQL
jgi:hypothetical protein